MNYIQKAKEELSKKIDVENELLNLYTLLVFSKAGEATLEDIHDAWSIWRNETKPDHKSLVPFSELTLEVQEMDREYTEAINSTYYNLSTPLTSMK